MTSVLDQARRRRVTALAVLLVVGGLAIAFLVSPWGRTRTDRQIERDQLFRKVRADEAEMEPLADIDKKIEIARQEIAEFESTRLPAEYSAISDTLGKFAGETGVQLSDVRYDPGKDAVGGLRPVDMTATVAGSYPEIMRFINSMERSKMFFIVNGVSLQEQSGGSLVRLQLSFETYLRSAE